MDQVDQPADATPDHVTPDSIRAAGKAGVLAADGIDRQLLEELFDHTPDIAFFIKDAAGRYTTVNHSLVERHGLNGKADLIGRRPADVCAGSFGRIPTEQDAAVLRTGRPIVDHLELHWLLPHRPVWCLTTKLPLRDAAEPCRGASSSPHHPCASVVIKARDFPKYPILRVGSG